MRRGAILIAGVLALALFSGRIASAQFETGANAVGPRAEAAQPPPPSRISISAQFSSPQADRPSRLFVIARIAPGWHIYSITQPAGGPVRSVISVAPSQAYQVGPFQALTPPEAKKDDLFGGIMVESHHDQAIWYAPIQWTPGVDPSKVAIDGRLKVQTCDASSCYPPQEYGFRATIGPGIALPEDVRPATATAAATTAAATTAVSSVDLSTLLVKLAAAFLGGIILNLMPCVLPVISLKIFSFLEQAGESRSRVLMLNIWYCLGLFSVFMLLAALAASLRIAWGEQFTLPWFKVALTGLVFAMALSFLGTWEIPIPGFVGSGKAGQLQVKEGAAGAFFKGVFTTVLATPCSGPLLGGVFGYLLTQPPFVTYLMFGAIGLGMASPYLVIGANPELMRFLPRPGQWMDTLKQLMGFLLLFTVVYMFSTMSEAYFIPTLTMLVGLWFACWWIGRTPLTAELGEKLKAWIGAAAAAAAVGLFAFTVLMHESGIAWQPFSPEALARARAEGKTVMVDFTADWCPTCKANLKFAIDRPEVRKLIAKNGIVPMIADWTDYSPVIKQALNELGYNSIPVLAVWSADGKPTPTVLSDLLRESQVIEALKAAGPSSVEGASGPIALRP